MHESNRGPADEEQASGAAGAPGEHPGAPPPGDPPTDHFAPAAGPADAPSAGFGDPAPSVPSRADVSFEPAVLHALRIWFGLIAGLGLLSMVAGLGELALMVVLAAVFIAAQAADRDPTFEKLRLMLSAVFVIGASVSFGLLAVWLANSVSPGLTRSIAVGIAGGGAVACLVTSLRSFADGLSFVFFRTHETNHTLRLGARVVLMMLLFAYPGWVAAPLLLEQLEDMRQPLLDTGQMVSTVVGMCLLGLGAVGFLIKRDVPQTLARLGIEPLRLSHIGIVLIGIVALFAINLGSEWLQRMWFPDLWARDQRINQMLAGGITLAGGLLLGISAGVGEEVAMRGALQPRLGLLLTSVTFAALHVHYSWYGMLMIFVLGAGLGWLRQRTSTTVAILVHALYDIVAVFAAVGIPKH